MKPNFFLPISLSILLLQTGYAQKTNPHRQHRTKTSLTRNTPTTKLVAQTIRPLSNVTNSNITLTDSLPNRLLSKNTGLLTQTKSLAVAAPTGTAKAVTEQPGRVQVANPQLMNELPMKPYLMPLDKASVRGSYPLGYLGHENHAHYFSVEDSGVRCRHGLRPGAGAGECLERPAREGQRQIGVLRTRQHRRNEYDNHHRRRQFLQLLSPASGRPGGAEHHYRQQPAGRRAECAGAGH